jgi:tetratricopeptide (TPR) repeat protein
MSPEQAAGRIREVGPAADIYALGAILYEVLTGKPPFIAQSPLETVLQVLGDEPVPPSRLQPKLPRDLETICLKCLQKDPRKRYLSAAALAADLRRFQSGEPILARRVRLGERAVKWARRRPTAAALAVVSSAAALALLIGGWWSNAALWESAQRERAKAQEVEKERAHAAAQQALAVAHLQNALDMLEPLSLEVKGEHLAKNQEGQYFRKQFAELARAFYQKLLADKDNPDRDVRRQIGRAFHGLGMTHAVVNEAKAAEESFLRAVALQEELVKEYPAEEDYRVDLALTYQNLGDFYEARDVKQSAAATYAKIVPLFQSLPRNNERVSLFAYKLANKLWLMGKSEEALLWVNRLIDHLEALLRDDTKAERRQHAAHALALNYYLRALLLVELGRPEEARAEFDRALNVKDAKLPQNVVDQCRLFSSMDPAMLKALLKQPVK